MKDFDTMTLSGGASVRSVSRRMVAAAGAGALMLLLAHGAQAQAYPGAGDAYGAPGQAANGAMSATNDSQVDPPGRVARIGVLEGVVSMQPAGVEQFSGAEINYPLTTGDRLFTDANSRAELQAGQVAARLGARTDFTVTALTDALAQFGLAQGSAHLRAFALDPDTTTEIDTPNSAVTLLMPSDVRVDALPDEGVTVVTVLSGQVQVQADGLQQVLRGGQALSIAGGGNGARAQVQTVRMAQPDDLDRWSAERDGMYERAMSQAGEYVNPGTIGYADLQQYGDWDQAGDDGPVWYPRAVAVDWAPYRVGHWAYIAPWGWTWVEAEPWGFAPFHYGRWRQVRGRWGWIPGPPVIHPVYSPALVVFVGGTRAGVAAWFPLGPREPWQPWFHASPRYVNRVNVTNIYTRNVAEVRTIYNNRSVNVYENWGGGAGAQRHWANRDVAVTAVPQDRFASGRPVRGSLVRLDEREISRGAVVARPVVAPDQAIVRPGTGRMLPPDTRQPVREVAVRGGAAGQNGAAANARQTFGPGGAGWGARSGAHSGGDVLSNQQRIEADRRAGRPAGGSGVAAPGQVTQPVAPGRPGAVNGGSVNGGQVNGWGAPGGQGRPGERGDSTLRTGPRVAPTGPVRVDGGAMGTGAAGQPRQNAAPGAAGGSPEPAGGAPVAQPQGGRQDRWGGRQWGQQPGAAQSPAQRPTGSQGQAGTASQPQPAAQPTARPGAQPGAQQQPSPAAGGMRRQDRWGGRQGGQGTVSQPQPAASPQPIQQQQPAERNWQRGPERNAQPGASLQPAPQQQRVAPVQPVAPQQPRPVQPSGQGQPRPVPSQPQPVHNQHQVPEEKKK